MPNIYANWDAPSTVVALTTTRERGFSKPPYDSNNLGLHVGDNPTHVASNRQALQDTLKLPGAPEWLDQTHSNLCVIVEEETNRIADAAITRSKGRTLAIMTADCLPILLCDKGGKEIAAIHAGWRGLVSGIIENTLIKMQTPPQQLMAWIGPAICQSCFEVGDDVLEAYKKAYSFSSNEFLKHQGKWLANLPMLAEKILTSLGVFKVYQSKICTFERKTEFYSYRRDSQTGRMATLIWLNERNWE